MSTLVHTPSRIVTAEADIISTPVDGHVRNLIRMFSPEGILNTPRSSYLTPRKPTVVYANPISGLDSNTSVLLPVDTSSEVSSPRVSDLVIGFESPPRDQSISRPVKRTILETPPSPDIVTHDEVDDLQDDTVPLLARCSSVEELSSVVVREESDQHKPEVVEEEDAAAVHEKCPLLDSNGNEGQGDHSGVGDLTLANTKRTTLPWVEQYTDVKDGHYFILLMNDQRAHVKSLYQITEKFIDQCELSEEVAGILRVTVGKAKLVIKKRLTHFENLCNNQINQAEDAERYTHIADLAGFWEVVLLQVDDICDQFAEIEKLRINNWIKPQSQNIIKNKMTKTTKKQVSKKVVLNPSKNAERALARKRLIEMKRAAAKQNKMAVQENEIEIYVT